ncbi:WAT1-related protein At2g37460-like [Impatiens glandulifera]|uniref:WAT1-related protein At2g37460-like n=1 Tax=Impatiens glandulifera TaxID=253017 RepID=UPI001FB0EAA1|nr:WAT1-related protein At2g37460-like [Impatiens glandulifera]
MLELQTRCIERAKPFLAVIFIQFGYAGMDLLTKVALNEGMSNYVFVVYRHAIATFLFAPFAFFKEKDVRPNMTFSIFTKLISLSLLEPVIDQNLYFLGMKYTTATFASSMFNILPAITFVMACIFRLENVRMNSIHSQAKIIGTITTISGAMLMTLMKGPIIPLPWTNGRTTRTIISNHHGMVTNSINLGHSIKGSIMVFVGCLSSAGFIILQAMTVKAYPAELSLTAWICFLGTLNGAIVAAVMERGNPSAWSIGYDYKLLTTLYTGIVCTGLIYYIQGMVMKERGPVFVTAFSPLSMVIVATLSSFILLEKMYLGRVIGAIIIATGLYVVVWGKSQDYNKDSSDDDELDRNIQTNLGAKLQIIMPSTDD